MKLSRLLLVIKISLFHHFCLHLYNWNEEKDVDRFLFFLKSDEVLKSLDVFKSRLKYPGMLSLPRVFSKMLTQLW
jgi:hypothetical protein